MSNQYFLRITTALNRAWIVGVEYHHERLFAGWMAYVFTLLAVFSFLLLLLTQGSRWIVASTVDRALVTPTPVSVGNTGQATVVRAPCSSSFSERSRRSEVIDQIPLAAVSPRGEVKDKTDGGPEMPFWDAWQRPGSLGLGFLWYWRAIAVLPTVDFPACCYV